MLLDIFVSDLRAELEGRANPRSTSVR